MQTRRKVAIGNLPRKSIGARRIIEGEVHNPFGHDTSVVVKIYDPVVAMLKRRQITSDQFQAAERLQLAYETVHGQAGGAMDFERSRGSGLPGKMPAPPYMVASETLRLAKMWLYPRDYAVVHRVCIQGIKVSDCAQLFGPGKEGKLEAGRALKRGLTQLAEKWGYSSIGRRAKPSVFRDEELTVGEAGIIIRGETFVMS